jgi:non-specific protein-tyrosine kinase
VGADVLARTYAESLKTQPVLDEAARRMDLPANHRDMLQSVTVRPIAGTQLLRLTVDGKDPNEAATLANTVVTVFSEQNQQMQTARFESSRQSLEQLVASLRTEIDSRSQELQQLRSTRAASDADLARAESEFAQLQSTYGDSVRTFESLRIAEARGLNGVSVVEPAAPPPDPVRPNKIQAALFALLAGALVAVGLAKVIDYVDDGLRDRERLVQVTGLQPLGLIPAWPAAGDGLVVREQAGAASVDPASMRAAEAYRLLFNVLQVTGSQDQQQIRALMLASAAIDEGKSLTAANLAAVLAEAGRRVILVDADLHRPSQMNRFQLPNTAGLSTLLSDTSVTVDGVVRDTRVSGLRVLTSGPATPAASALFTSPRLVAIMADLRAACDVVVFDTPPALGAPDAALLAPHADAVLFVVDARKSHGRQVRRALTMLRQAGARVIGAAFNRVSAKSLAYLEYGAPTTREDAAASQASPATTLGSTSHEVA